MSTASLSRAAAELSAVHKRQCARAAAAAVPAEGAPAAPAAPPISVVSALVARARAFDDARTHGTPSASSATIRAPQPLPPPRCTPRTAPPPDGATQPATSACTTSAASDSPAAGDSPVSAAWTTPVLPPGCADGGADGAGSAGSRASSSSDEVRAYLARRKSQLQAQQASAERMRVQLEQFESRMDELGGEGCTRVDAEGAEHGDGPIDGGGSAGDATPAELFRTRPHPGCTLVANATLSPAAD